MNNKFLLSIAGIFLVILSIYVGVLIYSNIRSINTNYFNVAGTGEAVGKPDIAMLNVSVRTEKEKTEQAMKENTEKANNIIDFLKNQGIEEKDIKTSALSVYPIYKENKIVYEYNFVERETQEKKDELEDRIRGYEVFNNIEIKLRDIEKAGLIIDEVIKLGANEISNLNFIVENSEDLKKIAREKAVENAKEKAEKLASSLGLKIVKITGFYEETSYPYGMGGGMDFAKEASSPMNIQVGENKITATVNLTFEVR